MSHPTRVRYSIVALAMAINMVCYTDRACIALAGPRIRDELHFSQWQMGLVFSIFSLAYAAGQGPWGALADRFGSRRIIAAAICCWSAFTAMTGAVWGFASMLAVRLMFGALEAALSPATAVAFTRWVPIKERATSFGAFLSGGRVGAALTPPLAAILMLRFGWRVMFAIFGAIGIPTAAVWLFWYRDYPSEHPSVNPEEKKIVCAGINGPTETGPVAAPGWGELFRSSRLRSLVGVAFGSTFLWQFYITWFPTYLIEKLGMPLREASLYAGMPFLLGAVANWAGGLATDFLTRRFGARRGRTFLGCSGLLLAGAFILLAVFSPAPRIGALLMVASAGAIDLTLGAAWSSAVEIGGRSGGAAAGVMNASSNCAAFASPAIMGWVLQSSNNWNIVLLTGAMTTLLAAFLWLRVNPPQHVGSAS